MFKGIKVHRLDAYGYCGGRPMGTPLRSKRTAHVGKRCTRGDIFVPEHGKPLSLLPV